SFAPRSSRPTNTTCGPSSRTLSKRHPQPPSRERTVHSAVQAMAVIEPPPPMRNRKQETIARLFEVCGRTFADELNIRVERKTPSGWLKLLVYVLLSSRRSGNNLSLRATREIFEEGWTTPRRMAKTTWEQRVEVLDRAHYVRYDYRTATYLGDTTNLLLEKY